ncbi:hypothetical protein WOLCODRAFT_159609 [Wolfiporia cocos MD-104 SS10]|uniref:Uncharacterized protein n=1 Tax=Wolfiporia cocos (strain MD-104) TaxID=742152 RepID=A0A2H3JAX6_WOLCO|nr:hypothetical protein WOLCODRAFT_159609 [Wolfiporia cocos MD-104 SS10]
MATRRGSHLKSGPYSYKPPRSVSLQPATMWNEKYVTALEDPPPSLQSVGAWRSSAGWPLPLGGKGPTRIFDQWDAHLHSTRNDDGKYNPTGTSDHADEAGMSQP